MSCCYVVLAKACRAAPSELAKAKLAAEHARSHMLIRARGLLLLVRHVSDSASTAAAELPPGYSNTQGLQTQLSPLVAAFPLAKSCHSNKLLLVLLLMRWITAQPLDRAAPTT